MPGVVHEVVETVAAPTGFQPRANILDELRKAGDVADVELQRDSLSTQGFDLAHDSLRTLCDAVIGKDDVTARACDFEGGVTPKAEPDTGDDDRKSVGRGKRVPVRVK